MKVPDKVRMAISKSDSDWNEIKARAPEAWAEAVRALPEEKRWYVASVIWWDFFSNRTSGERWDALDPFINCRGQELGSEELVEGLMACGYPKARARVRVYPDEYLCNSAALRKEGVRRMKRGEHPAKVAELMGVARNTAWTWSHRAGLSKKIKRKKPTGEKKEIQNV